MTWLLKAFIVAAFPLQCFSQMVIPVFKHGYNGHFIFVSEKGKPLFELPKGYVVQEYEPGFYKVDETYVDNWDKAFPDNRCLIKGPGYGKWYFIDKAGNKKILLDFENQVTGVTPYSNGYSRITTVDTISRKNWVQYLDSNGTPLRNKRFYYGNSFSDGMAKIKPDKETDCLSFIDTSGKIMWTLPDSLDKRINDYGAAYKNGFFICGFLNSPGNKKAGITFYAFDKLGRIVFRIPENRFKEEYITYMECFEPGLFLIVTAGTKKRGIRIMDKSGKIIHEIKDGSFCSELKNGKRLVITKTPLPPEDKDKGMDTPLSRFDVRSYYVSANWKKIVLPDTGSSDFRNGLALITQGEKSSKITTKLINTRNEVLWQNAYNYSVYDIYDSLPRNYDDIRKINTAIETTEQVERLNSCINTEELSVYVNGINTSEIRINRLKNLKNLVLQLSKPQMLPVGFFDETTLLQELELNGIDASNLLVCLKNLVHLKTLRLVNVTGSFNEGELKQLIPGLEITKRNY